MALECLGTALVCERRAAQGFLMLQVVGEQLAVCHRIQALTSCLCAVQRGVAAVLSGIFALLGGEFAALRRAFSLPGGAHEDVDAGQCVRVVIALGGGVELLHRLTALIGETVALQRRAIAGVCAHVALVGDGQTRAGGPIAIVGGLLALMRRALAVAVADLMCARVRAVCAVAIASVLLAIGRELVLVGAGLLLSIERPVGGGTLG